MHRSFEPFRRSFDILGASARARRDRRHLQELPDYLLRDIGLSRSDIAAPAMPSGLAGPERWGSWG